MQTEIKNKLKENLSRSLKKHEISIRDLLVILTILKKAEDDNELHFLIELLKDKYPPLLDLIIEEKIEEKIDFEHLVQEFISEIISENPILAVEIGEIALEKGTTLELLKEKFPQFNDFLEQKQK